MLPVCTEHYRGTVWGRGRTRGGCTHDVKQINTPCVCVCVCVDHVFCIDGGSVSCIDGRSVSLVASVSCAVS